MDGPKISIVMPSYNQGQYLEEAISSVLNQSYPNKELIVIDGGSTDNSVDIIRKYQKHLSYWVSEKDKGQTHAIQNGFEHATGDWLNWINSDDALLPDALEAIAETAEKYPKIDMIAGRGVIGDEKGRFVQVIRPVIPWMWMPRHACYGQICQQSIFFSRRAYEEVGGLDAKLFFRMDTNLYERILSFGFKVKVITSTLGFFRTQPDAKSTLNQDIRRKELAQRLIELGISEKRIKCALLIMRAYRLFSGHYLCGLLASEKIKEDSLQSVWLKCLDNNRTNRHCS